MNENRVNERKVKTIKIYVGDNLLEPLYEEKLHPVSQIKKAETDLNKRKDNYAIYTNSVHLIEYFNKYGKRKGYKVTGYYNKKIHLMEFIFSGFSKPFNKLIFG